MSAYNKIIEFHTDHTNLSVTALKNLYEGALADLKASAEVRPDEESYTHEAREVELLDFESFLLTRAARVPLKSSEEINVLMDIWVKAAGIESGQALRASDKIVLNIFRHLSAHLP